MVDIFSEMRDVDFDAAWAKRIDVKIDAGLQVPFIDVESLIASKLASGRLEDLADVEALRRAARNSAKQTDED